MGSYRDSVDQVKSEEVVLQNYASEAAGSVKSLRAETAAKRSAQEELRDINGSIQSLQTQYQGLYNRYLQAVRKAQQADSDDSSDSGEEANAILGQMLSVQQQIQSEQANAEKKKAEIRAIKERIEKRKKELQEYRDYIMRRKLEIDNLQQMLYEYYQAHADTGSRLGSLGGLFGSGAASSRASVHSGAAQECSEAIKDCGMLKTYADRTIMHIDEELQSKETDKGFER